MQAIDPARPGQNERKLGTSAVLPAIIALALWCVYLLDQGLHLDLYQHGIYPRTLQGLPGVLFSPFIHGDTEHVLNNSIPVVVLGTALMYFFPRLAGRVLLYSWLVSGLGVWLSARASYHIGASGIVYGLAAFLFTTGVLRKQRMLMGLSLLVVFLYGSMLWGVVPLFPKISWESHFWGAAAGVAMAFAYRNIPSVVRDPREVVWPEEEEEDGTADGAVDPAEADEQGASSWRTSHSWQRFGPKDQETR